MPRFFDGSWKFTGFSFQTGTAFFMKRIRKNKSPREHGPSFKAAWKDEKLYFKGDGYFQDLLKSIRGAKKSVDFETYIFEPGRLGDQVVGGLVQAAGRGVKVRVLVDGVGSSEFAAHYGPRLEKAGAGFHVYRSWPVIFSTACRLFRLNRINRAFRTAHSLLNSGNRRDHRKVCLVDGRRVWMGSFNVADCDLESLQGKKAWRDTGLSLSGVTSLVFQRAFDVAWEDRWPKPGGLLRRRRMKGWIARELAGTPIRLTLTRRLRVAYRKELLKRFQSAHRRIWVLTPYFIPTHSLLKALVNAARRGCEVRLVLPGSSDVPMARWAAMAFYHKLIKAGCHIVEYQRSILHAKTLVVDDWFLVGSSNLNQRSLRKDLEVNVVLQQDKSKRAVEKQFVLDGRQSREVTLAVFKRRPFWIRTLSWFFFRFRFWF
jgi:cardiolipin synthase